MKLFKNAIENYTFLGNTYKYKTRYEKAYNYSSLSIKEKICPMKIQDRNLTTFFFTHLQNKQEI